MAKSKLKQVENSAKNITSLRPEEHLIKRMNLTFSNETGDESHPFSSQKSVACREIIDNGVSEITRKYGDYLRVHFYKDGAVEVTDNGRGLPTDSTINAFKEKVSGFVITMGTLQSGENLGENEAQGKATNQNGLGGSAVNFLSNRMDIKVYKNKKIYSLSFKNGKPGFFDKDDDVNANFTPLKDLTYIKEEKDNRSKEEKEKLSKGTSIKFWLNDKVFGSPYPIDIDDMIVRIKGTAFLLPHNTFEVINEMRTMEDGSYQHEIYNFEVGIPQLVEFNQVGKPIMDIAHFSTVGAYVQKNVPVQEKNQIVHKNIERTVDIEFAFGYTDKYEYTCDSYVNTIRTRLGGVHVDSLETALAEAFNERILSMKSIIKASDPTPIVDDYKEGLNAVISVYVSEPEFSNQIKEKLGGRVVKKAIYDAVYKELSEFAKASKNQNTMRIIAEKVVAAAKVRKSRKEEQEIKREKAKLNSKSTSKPEKLIDCEITHDPNSELYIAEGDSAIGSLKAARYALYQALLPIRGKILNVLKEKSMKKILENKEIQDIIKCFDAGVGEDFDLDSSRYQRLFFAVDADVDGGQIASLLTLVIYKLFPGFIESGNVYKMESPLFIVKEKKVTEPYYFYFQKDYDDFMEELNAENASIEEKNAKNKVQKPLRKIDSVIRAKGLGEVNAKVLRHCSMNPETRLVTRITIGDVKEAEHALMVAMGDDEEIRREWINLVPIEDFSD